jgi:hypothetical protein
MSQALKFFLSLITPGSTKQGTNVMIFLKPNFRQKMDSIKILVVSAKKWS